MRLWGYLRKSASCDSGVFALLTLVFFIACGMTAIFILWGIAHATAVYNVAYYTTQTAATSAASSACVPGDYDSNPEFSNSPCDSGEIVLPCPAPSSGVGQCQQGDFPFFLASQSLNQSLKNGTPGIFGLRSIYNPDTDPSDPSVIPMRINTLIVYNISARAGAEARKYGCTKVPDSPFDSGTINQPEDGSSVEPPGTVGCWTAKENGIQAFPWQYETGLVLSTRAPMRFPSFCREGDPFCVRLNINSVGAARVVQKTAPRNYELYDCYGRERDLEDLFGTPTGNCEYDTSF